MASPPDISVVIPTRERFEVLARTLDSLAKQVHLSRSQLVRAFNAVTSLGPMAYLRLMRVQPDQCR